MYNSERSKRLEIKDLDDLLKRTTEYDIYARYLGTFKIGSIYNSPLRKDKNPSFGVFYSKRTGRLLYKDLATGESGDVVKFVSSVTGTTGYINTIYKIMEDLNITNRTKLIATKPNYESEEVNIAIVRQSYTTTDNEYWNRYRIRKQTLNLYKVFSIKYYLCNGIVRGTYSTENPMYAYKVNEGFKIYRPLASKFTKWRNNLTPNDIQGYEQLPENGDLLIITKSLKDVMVFKEMGYNAISPSSETAFLSDDQLKAISKRFKRLLVCFDRDVPGIQNMRKIKRKTGLDGFLVHKKFKSKDLSDAVELNGFDTVKKWLTKELNNEQKNNKVVENNDVQ